MTSAHHIVVAVLLLVVLAREGFALKCVICNSAKENEQDCDDSPKNYLQPCSENATSCRKMEQEIYYDDDYQVRTIRQCAVESGPMDCIERTGTYRFKVFYCHCKDDGCNGAGSLSISAILAVLSAAFTLLFRL